MAVPFGSVATHVLVVPLQYVPETAEQSASTLQPTQEPLAVSQKAPTCEAFVVVQSEFCVQRPQ